MMQNDESLSEWAARLSPMITEVQVLIARLAKELGNPPNTLDHGDPPLTVPTHLVLEKCKNSMDDVWDIVEMVDYIIKRLGG